MKKILVMLIAVFSLFVFKCSAIAANDLVPLSESNSETFYMMMQINDVALNIRKNYNIVFTQLARNTKFDLPNQDLVAYNCAYGIKGQSKPSGALIFYENSNKCLERIKIQSFSSDTNSRVTSAVLLMCFPPLGLVDNTEVELLLQNKEPVKNVWCKLKQHRIMLAESEKDNSVLLFATKQ